MPDADQALMLAFQQGDESAFTELVGRFQNRILNYIWKMAQDRHAAQDLAQETFVRLFTSAGRYEPRAPFAGFLFRIATNLTLNYLRDTRRRRALPLGEVRGDGQMQLPDTRQPGPAALAAKGELAEAVRVAISLLPDQQRAAVMLRRSGGLCYAEIAQALATSIPAVKSLLFRARTTLRKQLADFIEGGL